MSTIVIFLAALAWIAAFIALIKPSWVKAKGRISGFLLYLLLGIALSAAGGALMTDSEKKDMAERAEIREAERAVERAKQVEEDKIKEAERAVERAKQAEEDKIRDAERAVEREKREAERAIERAKQAEEDKIKEAERRAAELEANKPYVTTALQLHKDYEENEVAADEKIGKHPVEISGTIDGIDKNAFNNIVITLKTSNQFMPARLNMEDSEKEKAIATKKGRKTTIICKRMARIMGSPSGSKCFFK